MLVRVVFHRSILNKHVTLQLLIKVFEFIYGQFVSVRHEAKSGEWINMTPGNGFERKKAGGGGGGGGLEEKKLIYFSFKNK